MTQPSKLAASIALALAGAALAAPAALASPPPAMTVAVHPAGGAASSYFTLSAKPGQVARAGTLELRNRSASQVTVRLDPVGALTASTLGSAYQVADRAAHGQARWVRLPRGRVVLAPHGRAIVPVVVLVPAGQAAGDYLSGISVEALGQAKESRVRGNIAISSVQRYAVGVLVQLPGPRHPVIHLTRASVEREPAGLTFFLFGRNAGNTILKDVRGSLLVTHGHRVVARTAIGPGTFVNGTSIAYPLLATREEPREGATYRVRAVMRYRGGVARLDTGVRFGHASAERQQAFGGPRVESRAGGPSSSLMAALAAALGAVAALVALALLIVRRRRRPTGMRATLRTLTRELAKSRRAGQPLSVIRIGVPAERASPRKLAALARKWLRRSDILLQN